MESQRFDATEQNSLKPDTTVELEIDELISNSSADDTPPAMIIVETCITNSSKDISIPLKQQAADAGQKTEAPAEQATCSISLGLKPNVQFQILSQTVDNEKSLASTEAALAAANISCPTAAFAGSCSCSELPPMQKLRRCVDGATQCNNLNLDCEASNSSDSMPSIGSLVCRICHNADNPEQLVSPCLCKGSLTYVHVHCLERWISTSRCTICELCQFHYNTEQTLRYTCLQSLRLWYSRAMSRRALQEDCQMFSLLTLVAFGIIGTLLVGIQYYALHTQSWGLSKLWTKSWMLFFLLMTVTVYFANVYMLIKSQLTPWYRWWQSARDIKLILENRRPFPNPNRVLQEQQRQQQQQLTLDTGSTTASMFTHHDQLDVQAARSSSQPRFLTPSSSASSLPRAVAPRAEQQKAALPTCTEMAIEMALSSLGPNPRGVDCKETDEAAAAAGAAADASATKTEEEQKGETNKKNINN